MSKLGPSLGWLIHRRFGRASPLDKTALTGNQADDACSNPRWINSPGCKRDFCWVRMVTAVRVPSVLAASSCFAPISIRSAMISVALLGSGSRKVAWTFQISHCSMLGSSLIFVVMRASILFIVSGSFIRCTVSLRLEGENSSKCGLGRKYQSDENRKQTKNNASKSRTIRASRARDTPFARRLSHLNLTKIRTRMIEIRLNATTARCGISVPRFIHGSSRAFKPKIGLPRF
jgi:hypothetical protein